MGHATACGMYKSRILKIDLTLKNGGSSGYTLSIVGQSESTGITLLVRS